MQLVQGYDVLEVRGNAYDRGFSYGSHHAALLKRLLKSHYDVYSKYNVTKEAALAEASKFVEPIRNYSEMVAEEQKGTADGAGVKLEEVIMVGAFIEVLDVQVFSQGKGSRQCTSFAARGTATSDGLTYVGQNNDEPIDPWLGGDCTTLTRYVQGNAPRALIYTYCGVPAMMGINSEGLSVCLNGLTGGKPRYGVPVMAVVREVLNQRNLDEALREIERAKLAFNLNFVIGTPEGIMDIEAYPDEVYAHRSSDIIWHANNWLYSNEKRDEYDEYFMNNSRVRTERMKSLLEANRGKLNLNVLEGILSDHESRPDPICWHVDQSNPASIHIKTFDSMIYIPEKREAWIRKCPPGGNPCDGSFQKYIA